ncbi:MAG: hypothetical protein LUE29_07725 [Lachnospiraceae bacterium]|nr:hypothetical protein [Lachnospiraceae bacterium]
MLKRKGSRALAWVMTFVLLLGMVVTPTYAEETGTESNSTTATSLPEADNGVITLTSNVTLGEYWTVSGTVTLDLAGFTLDLGSNRITVAGGASLTINDSSTENSGVVTSSDTSRVITVNGGTLIVNGGTIISTGTSGGWGCAAIGVFGTNDSTVTEYSTVTVNSKATLKTTGGSEDKPGYGVAVWYNSAVTSTYQCYGVTVNIYGTCTDAYLYVNGSITESVSGITFNISGATITGQYGIYAAGYATWNIENSTISGGASGIEIRAGVLNVTNSKITASSTSSNTTENWNGATVTGAAIAVSQHSTSQKITVNIVNSTVSGYYGVLEVNTNETTNAAVSVTISGESTYVSTTATDDVGAAVYSQNNSNEDGMTTVTITGGTYNSDVSEYVSATAAVEASSNDGTYTVSALTAETAIASVKTGDTTTYYSSLQSALDAAEDSSTVTLLQDVTLNESLIADLGDGISVALELNGYTITFAYDDNDQFNGTTLSDGAWGLKVASGTLTIQDSSEGGTGSIVTADVNTYVDVVGAAGTATLNITSGNYTTNTIYEAVVYATGTATVNISGGTFTNSATSYAYNSEYTAGLTLNIGNSSGATINVTGGTFYGRSPAEGDDSVSTVTTFVNSSYKASAIRGDSGDGFIIVEAETVAIITDEDGNETEYKSLSAVSTALKALDADSEVTVTMVDNSYDSPFKLETNISVTLNLNGYSINMSSSASYPRTPITVSAGSLTIIDSSETEDEDGTVTYGGTVAAGENSSQGAVYNDGGTVTIEGGNYCVLRTYTAAIVTNGTSAATIINGGVVTGNSYALQVTTGSLTVNGGYFYSALGTDISVATSSGSETKTAGESGSCIMVRKDGDAAAKLTITGGYFKCGISFTPSSTDTTGQAIISTGSSTNSTTTYEPTITISGGVFSSNRYNSVKTYLANADYYALSFLSSTEDSELWDAGYRFKVGLSNYLLGHYATESEAEEDESVNEGDFVIDSGYTTAKEAVAAADNDNNVIVVNVESGEDNPITTSISVTNTVTEITLDLNGCYISTSNPAISVALDATLTIVDSEGTANVTSSSGQAGVVRNNGGTLTIQGGTYVQTGGTGSSTPYFTFVVYTAVASGDNTTTDEQKNAASTSIEGGKFINENGYDFGSYIGSLNISGGYMSASSLLYANSGVNTKNIITGGYYTDSTNPEGTSYLAESYEVYDSGIKTYTHVVTLESVASIKASDGSYTYYTTLETAIGAAETGETVTLLKSTELGADVTISASITLKLDDYTVTTNGHTIYIAADATVIVNADEGGVVNETAATGNSCISELNVVFYVYADGELTLNGGTYKSVSVQMLTILGTVTIVDAALSSTAEQTNDNSILNSYSMISVSGSSATLNFVSGSLNAGTSEGTYFDLYGIYVSNGGNVVLGSADDYTGPTIDSVNAAIGMNNTTSPATITIYGGTYTIHKGTTSSSSEKYVAVLYLSGDSTVNIYGGIFTNASSSSSYTTYTAAYNHVISIPYVNTAVNLNIYGGTFDTGSNDASVFYEGTSTGTTGSGSPEVTITGGTYSDDSAETYLSGTVYQLAYKDNNDTLDYKVVSVIVGKNIDLSEGRIILNVYVKSTDDNCVENTGSISGELDDETDTTRTSVTESTGSEDYSYILTQAVAAEKMVNTLTVTVTLSDGYVVTYKTSVKDYADEVMSDLDENEQAVLVAMLDLGSAMQEKIGYKADTLANGGTYSEAVKGVTDLTSAAKKTTSTSNWSGATLKSCNMVFSYEFAIVLTYSASVESYDVSVKLGDADYASASVTKSGKTVTISGLSATDLPKSLSVTLSSGDSYYTTNTTGLYYARLVVASGTDAQKTIGKTLYLYTQAVAALSE